MALKQRMYFKIYLAVLASIVIFAVATALLWRTLDDREERAGGRFDAMMQLMQNTMPDASLSPEQQQVALEKMNRNMRMSVLLTDASGQVLAQVGDSAYVQEGRMHRDIPPTMELHLADGRVAYVRPPRMIGGGRPPHREGDWPMGVAFLSGLGLLLGVVR